MTATQKRFWGKGGPPPRSTNPFFPENVIWTTSKDMRRSFCTTLFTIIGNPFIFFCFGLATSFSSRHFRLFPLSFSSVFRVLLRRQSPGIFSKSQRENFPRSLPNVIRIKPPFSSSLFTLLLFTLFSSGAPWLLALGNFASSSGINFNLLLLFRYNKTFTLKILLFSLFSFLGVVWGGRGLPCILIKTFTIYSWAVQNIYE